MLDNNLEQALHAAKDIASEMKEKEDCVEYAVIINNLKVCLEWLSRKKEDETPEASYKLVKAGQ